MMMVGRRGLACILLAVLLAVPAAAESVIFSHPSQTPVPSKAPVPVVTPAPAGQRNAGAAPAEGALPEGTAVIPGDSGRLSVTVGSVSATSYISSKWKPARMIDGQEDTCWQFSTKKSRLGKTYATFTLSRAGAVDGVWIRNGFWKTTGGKDQFQRNCRVKEMEIAFRYQGSGKNDWRDTVSVRLEDDRRDWQRIEFGRKENVAAVRFRIISVYRGSYYKNDVCISEVLFVRSR